MIITLLKFSCLLSFSPERKTFEFAKQLCSKNFSLDKFVFNLFSCFGIGFFAGNTVFLFSLTLVVNFIPSYGHLYIFRCT